MIRKRKRGAGSVSAGRLDDGIEGRERGTEPSGGEDAHELLERLEGRAECELDIHLSDVLKVGGKGRKVERVVPLPGRGLMGERRWRATGGCQRVLAGSQTTQEQGKRRGGVGSDARPGSSNGGPSRGPRYSASSPCERERRRSGVDQRVRMRRAQQDEGRKPKELRRGGGEGRGGPYFLRNAASLSSTPNFWR